MTTKTAPKKVEAEIVPDPSAPVALGESARDSLLAEYRAIKAAQAVLETREKAVKSALSDGAFAHFRATEDKKYTNGVQVRVLTDATVDALASRDWAMSDPYGRSKYLTVNLDNLPVLVGFLLGNPTFHGMLTADVKAVTDAAKEKFKALMEKDNTLTIEAATATVMKEMKLPDSLNLSITQSLQMAITEKDLKVAPAAHAVSINGKTV